MPKFARHLKTIEDSKKVKHLTEAEKMRKMVADLRDDEFKMQANLYAQSVEYRPPNVLSYEK